MPTETTNSTPPGAYHLPDSVFTTPEPVAAQ